MLLPCLSSSLRALCLCPEQYVVANCVPCTQKPSPIHHQVFKFRTPLWFLKCMKRNLCPVRTSAQTLSALAMPTPFNGLSAQIGLSCSSFCAYPLSYVLCYYVTKSLHPQKPKIRNTYFLPLPGSGIQAPSGGVVSQFELSLNGAMVCTVLCALLEGSPIGHCSHCWHRSPSSSRCRCFWSPQSHLKEPPFSRDGSVKCASAVCSC